MAKLRPYVLAISEGKKNSNMFIIMHGPFSSPAEAKVWGNMHCVDPRWNVVTLSKKRIGTNVLLVPIITPGGNES